MAPSQSYTHPIPGLLQVPHTDQYTVLFLVKQVFLLRSILLYRFLLASTHISTLHPFSSLSLAPCPWMALVDTPEISHVQILSAYRRPAHVKYSSPVPSPFPSPACSFSSHQPCLSTMCSSCTRQPLANQHHPVLYLQSISRAALHPQSEECMLTRN